ncbi:MULTISPECIES: hypothetical protein [unclassified Mycobacterium]|uniref:hypothetical protein n=1 Tax=unclassified Mycobacterium TaxID=2642494 RepID=UPI0007FCAAE8|nr:MULTISPECIES: hypothetical protein [unclassified Mycobacterium]OBG55774.1 hypothetical protein A5703_07440 [Mycobacterium sp. E188]OBH41090.1 hypothetical protein A5691_19385 [Mycobacterium sp. E183]
MFLWALFELGGDEDFVDVEAVYIRAFQLAPLRLSWRTREDLPDLKKCSKALRDAEARRPPLLVKRGSEMRRLTAEGQKWIEDNFDRLADSLRSDQKVQATRMRAPARLITDALRSSAHKTWAESGAITDEKWRIAEMLRCSPDSSRQIFRERLETLRAAAYAAGRDDALKFLDALQQERPEWF